MIFLPEKLELECIFFGRGGVNELILKENNLIFKWKSDSTDKILRVVEITPLDDEWSYFWSKMEEIGFWDWSEQYNPPENMCVDGHIFILKVKYQDKCLETRCRGNYPENLNVFLQTINEITDLQLDTPGGFGKI
ncbi:MAG: hypothetical protein ACLQG5_05885 [Methanobacterium sp.]|jgi:hypothetical protein